MREKIRALSMAVFFIDFGVQKKDEPVLKFFGNAREIVKIVVKCAGNATSAIGYAAVEIVGWLVLRVATD